MRQSRRLGGNSLEHIVNETVHDTHGFAGNSGVGMYLFQHLVDVDSIALLPLLSLLLVGLANVLLSLARLLHRFTTSFRWHVEISSNETLSVRVVYPTKSESQLILGQPCVPYIRNGETTRQPITSLSRDSSTSLVRCSNSCFTLSTLNWSKLQNT